MKKILLVLMITTISLNVFAQNYKELFLGNNSLSYKGLYLMFDSSKSWNNAAIYTTKPTSPYGFGKNLYLPDGNKLHTDRNFLSGKEFLVEEVIDEFEESSYYNSDYSIFKLNDGKYYFYYIYNKKTENFPFLVKGFEYSTDYVKSDIEREVDDFTGEIRLNSPILGDMVINKSIKKGVVNYYLRLNAYGSTLNYSSKGVIVLFEDGTKWSRPNEKIDVHYSSGGVWDYSAFIQLTQADLKLFSTKNIKKYRLYIYDNDNTDDIERFKYYVKAIMTMK